MPNAGLKGEQVNKRTIAAAGIALGLLLVAVGCVYIGNVRPVAAFIATPTTGTTPLNVVFDASGSTDADGTIETYAWDFGDGQTGSFTIAAAAHQFTVQSETKVFRVVLTVTDNSGGDDQAVVDITVDP
jgi:PKD repeat protein